MARSSKRQRRAIPPRKAVAADGPRLRLSLCMIARDEEATIGRALASAAPFVDEMIVVDTGSRDRTIEIARRLGARVFQAAWRNDFAAARNEALAHATGDWVLSLDADEALDPATAPNLRQLIARRLPYLRAHSVLIKNVHDREEVQLHYNSYAKRLFPRHPRVRWTRPIHEQVTHLDDERLLHYLISDDVVVYHYGYLKEIWDRKDKETRNREMLLAAIAADPADPFNYYNLGQEYYGQKRFADALPYFAQCLSLAAAPGSELPNYTAYAFALATGCCVETSELDRGIAIGEEGVHHHPYADLYCNLGSCYLRKGDLERAAFYYEKANSLAGIKSIYSGDVGSSTWRPMQNLGDGYALAGDPARALEYYRRAIAYEPTRPLPNLRAARMLLTLDRPSEAKWYLRQVLALFPDSEEANVGMAECLIAEDDKQAAYDRLDELVRQNPDSIPYRLRLAELLADEGESAVALSIFAEGLRREPKSDVFYERLGALLSRLGRHEDAANAYRVALSLNPANQVARVGVEAADILASIQA